MKDFMYDLGRIGGKDVISQDGKVFGKVRDLVKAHGSGFR